MNTAQLAHLAEIVDQSFFSPVKLRHLRLSNEDEYLRATLSCSTPAGLPFDIRISLHQDSTLMDTGTPSVSVERSGQPDLWPLSPNGREAFLVWWTEHFPDAARRHRYFERTQDRFHAMQQSLYDFQIEEELRELDDAPR